MALTSAEKQKARRERKSHGGLFRIREFWCHPDDEPLLRALEKELREKRLKNETPNACYATLMSHNSKNAVKNDN